MTIVIIYKDVRILIIQSGNRLIPEMSKDFGICYAKNPIQGPMKVILNTRVIDASANSVRLNNAFTA